VPASVSEIFLVCFSYAALAVFESVGALARMRPRPRQHIPALVAVVAVAVVLAVMGILREPTLPSMPATVAARPAAAIPPRPSSVASRALSGSWLLTSRVADTSVARFHGLVLDYELRLEQNGNRLRGAGVKAAENGRLLPSRARTPIEVDGSIDGQTVHLAFTEVGLRRTSRGGFWLQLDGDGSLAGRFWSDAARSSGTVTARLR
jgi:hypothetical protein